MARFLIVGAGYTGSRVAGLLRAAGHHVVATHRAGGDLTLDLPGDAHKLRELGGSDWRVVWSAPSVEGIDCLAGVAERVVYLSTTGVYGDAHLVDASTVAAPVTDRTRLRFEAEQVVLAGPWSGCVLRPAAIYGPGRGVHESIRIGRWKVAGDGSTYTSRIQVDDLAAVTVAAVLGELGGAWPVADEEPSTNLEITRFCCDLLGVAVPESAVPTALDETRRADRRVDGRAVLAELGVRLRYPSYRFGVAAALGAASYVGESRRDMADFDAFLLLSFGGPEKHDDVLPFLENVTRGRGVPRERLLEVAEHYYHFDGVSPINDQCRALLAQLHLDLPIYWGNRNWYPFLADTMRQMVADGRKKVLAFPTSAFSSYSGCRQYREDIAKAQAEVGEGAPEVVTVRRFFNHPGYVEVMTESLRAALAERPGAKVIFTAHSVPMTMANSCAYVEQLMEAARMVGGDADWRLAYQSRSGPPQIPWLEPDILDVLREEKAAGTTDVVLQPIGFLSDHMEVMYDLDYEAKHLAEELGLGFTRAATAGTHPRFVQMIRELVEEYTHGAPQQAVGNLPARPPVCQIDCCPAPVRPAGPPPARP